MPAEFDLIHWIRSQQKSSADVLLPACDDLAILKSPAPDLILVGMDQVLDGVHFDLKLHDPILIGQKAMNRNLSDCAAMACLPYAAVVSFALPKGISSEIVKSIYTGMKLAGEKFGCDIVGGDTGSWDQRLAISVAILGKSSGITPIRRSGAKPGDEIYVTGPLGGSILGRHLTFTPRILEARKLASSHRISAMIDLSDGLSRDLGHICHESKVGAVLQGSLIPIHDDVKKLPAGKLTSVEHALHDGEDHELCFTGEAGISRAIRIGVITCEPGIWMDEDGKLIPLQTGGFEHQF